MLVCLSLISCARLLFLLRSLYSEEWKCYGNLASKKTLEFLALSTRSKMHKCGGLCPLFRAGPGQGLTSSSPDQRLRNFPQKLSSVFPRGLLYWETWFSSSWLFRELFRLFRQPKKTHTNNLDCFHPFFLRGLRGLLRKMGQISEDN